VYAHVLTDPYNEGRGFYLDRSYTFENGNESLQLRARSSILIGIILKKKEMNLYNEGQGLRSQ